MEPSQYRCLCYAAAEKSVDTGSHERFPRIWNHGLCLPGRLVSLMTDVYGYVAELNEHRRYSAVEKMLFPDNLGILALI
jgi:hypothetical protein